MDLLARVYHDSVIVTVHGEKDEAHQVIVLPEAASPSETANKIMAGEKVNGTISHGPYTKLSAAIAKAKSLVPKD